MPMDSFKVPAAPVSRTLYGKVNEITEECANRNVFEENENSWSITDFDLGPRLTKCRFGYLRLARQKESHYVFAMKVLSKSKISVSQIESLNESELLHEFEIQYRLRHPNILRMYGYFHDEKHIYLILEYAKHGSLFKLLNERKHFDEKTVAIYVRDITRALIYCHTEGVIHRNIKPENLLIGHNGEVKLANTGCSVHPISQRTMTLCRKLDYSPPEMSEGEPDSYAADIWSLGVLCYELLVGLTTHNDRDFLVTFRDRGDPIKKYPDFISDKAKDLMGKLVVNDPKQRLPLTEILQHFWITENAPEGAQPPAFNQIQN